MESLIILGLLLPSLFETCVGLDFIFFWWNLLYSNFYLFFGWFHHTIRLVLDLAWFFVSDAYRVRTSISSLDGSLADLALSYLNITCLILD